MSSPRLGTPQPERCTVTVSNPLGYAVEVTLRCGAPERWTASPAAFRLEPGGVQAIDIRLCVVRAPGGRVGQASSFSRRPARAEGATAKACTPIGRVAVRSATTFILRLCFSSSAFQRHGAWLMGWTSPLLVAPSGRRRNPCVAGRRQLRMATPRRPPPHARWLQSAEFESWRPVRRSCWRRFRRKAQPRPGATRS